MKRHLKPPIGYHPEHCPKPWYWVLCYWVRYGVWRVAEWINCKLP